MWETPSPSDMRIKLKFYLANNTGSLWLQLSVKINLICMWVTKSLLHDQWLKSLLSNGKQPQFLLIRLWKVSINPILLQVMIYLRTLWIRYGLRKLIFLRLPQLLPFSLWLYITSTIVACLSPSSWPHLYGIFAMIQVYPTLTVLPITLQLSHLISNCLRILLWTFQSRLITKVPRKEILTSLWIAL